MTNLDAKKTKDCYKQILDLFVQKRKCTVELEFMSKPFLIEQRECIHATNGISVVMFPCNNLDKNGSYFTMPKNTLAEFYELPNNESKYIEVSDLEKLFNQHKVKGNSLCMVGDFYFNANEIKKILDTAKILKQETVNFIYQLNHQQNMEIISFHNQNEYASVFFVLDVDIVVMPIKTIYGIYDPNFLFEVPLKTQLKKA